MQISINRIINTRLLDSRRRSHLRLAEPTDATLIYQLRSDHRLSRFLNASTTTIVEQATWLERYKKDEAADKQYYFIIVSDKQDRGTVRMYDFRVINRLRSFCWGSWIIAPPPVVGLASYSALAVYELGFEHLGFEHAHFDVRRENESVINFHLRSGASIVDENEQDYFFYFSRDAYEAFRSDKGQIIERHSAISSVI